MNDKQVRATVPVGRRGSVDDIGSAVSDLASEEAGYVTGHVLAVDGPGGLSGGRPEVLSPYALLQT